MQINWKDYHFIHKTNPITFDLNETFQHLSYIFSINIWKGLYIPLNLQLEHFYLLDNKQENPNADRMMTGWL